MAFSLLATRTVCSCGLNPFFRPPTMCSPGRVSVIVTGAFPLSSPSMKTSTSGSLAMMRRLPLPLAAAPKVAATFTCCPATTVTV